MSARGIVDAGMPPVRGWESTAVRFHGFGELPADEAVESPTFRCLGREWTLKVESGDEICVLLTNWSAGTRIECYFTVRNSARQEVVCSEPQTLMFAGSGGSHHLWGYALHSVLIDALVEGTLTIEIWMRRTTAGIAPIPVFVPENPLCKNILRKFLQQQSADVIFEVAGDDGRGGGAHKKAKTSAAVFHAHRSVLQHAAPTLADICKGRGEEPITVQITGVRAEVFRLLLYYCYGGTLSGKELEANARDLIDAADKYDLASLKLAAEARYVQTTALAIDNVLENLLYAHSKSCALLQEAAMDFVVANGELAIDRISFDDVPSSLMKDLLVAVERGKKEDGTSKSGRYNSMRVVTLRKMLHEKELDVDGTREAMIARLKEHS